MYIDILIPSKNPDENLLKTVESLSNIKEINQIIIIDDSQNIENKIYIAIKANHPKINLLQNNNKPGISGALNTGIDSSKSKLIARIDSGDICLDKKRFKKIIKIFEEKIDIDLICSGIKNNKNKKIKPLYFYSGNVLSPFSRVPHPTWVFKKSSIKVKYKNKNKRFEDYAFLLDNNMKIFHINQYDLLYDTSQNLSRLIELRTAYLKSIYFLNKSQKDLSSIFTAITYLILRSVRLIFSSKKVLF